MKVRPKQVLAVLVAVPYLALGWIVGLVLLAIVTVRAARRFDRLRRALAPLTRCGACHGGVEQYGAFACASCRARTLGWAWRCGACGAWHGHIECPHCGMSVMNPLLEAP